MNFLILSTNLKIFVAISKQNIYFEVGASRSNVRWKCANLMVKCSASDFRSSGLDQRPIWSLTFGFLDKTLYSARFSPPKYIFRELQQILVASTLLRNQRQVILMYMGLEALIQTKIACRMSEAPSPCSSYLLPFICFQTISGVSMASLRETVEIQKPFIVNYISLQDLPELEEVDVKDPFFIRSFNSTHNKVRLPVGHVS